jgi:ABC-2 type transport system permease protein
MRITPPQPGSFPWLFAHDLRLNWRRFTSMFSSIAAGPLVALMMGGGIVLHLIAWPVVAMVAPILHPSDGASTGPLAGLITAIVSWMLAQSLFGATRALYDRGDLDLLLGSPLAASKVFAAKAAAIAISTFGSVAILTLPLANVGALIDRSAWLAVYPVLMALALIATALGLALTIWLFGLIGPQRARVYLHVTGATIGGGFILAAQIVSVLPAPLRDRIYAWIADMSDHADGTTHHLLRLPIDSLQGDIGSVALLMVLALLMFAVVVRMLGVRFADASLSAVGASAGNNSRNSKPLRFQSGLGRCLRVKEWRLLVRDPNMLAQLSLQIVYTIPVAVVLLRSEKLPAVLAIAPTIVVIAAQVAASLAWLTVSGEDAPELIETAPVKAATVDRAKLSAILGPLLIIVTVPLLALANISVHAALIAAVCVAGASASTALLNFWHPMPGNRRGMLRRHAQSKLVALVEHALAMLWAITSLFAIVGSEVAFGPLAVALGILAVCRARHRRVGSVARVDATPSPTKLANHASV